MEVIEASTGGVVPAPRIEEWSGVLTTVFGPIDVAPQAHGGFYGQLRSLRRGGLRFNDIAYRGLSLHRSVRAVARMQTEYFTLTRPISGPLAVEHERRMRVLQPGFVYLFNHAVPYHATAEQEYHTVSVSLPADKLRRRLPVAEPFYALPMQHERDPSAASLLCSFADHLAAAAGQGADEEFASLTEHFIDLIALLMLRPGRPLASSESSTILAHRERALKYIREHLLDNGLTPARVAAACGISLSYLKAVFRGTGSGIEEHIFAERLEYSRRALVDPRLSHTSISTIAYAAGFSHPAHFARAFKRRFGATPTELRKRR